MTINASGKTPVALIRQNRSVRAAERRAGTTTRPPVPRGIYEKDIDKCIKGHKIPPELVLMQSRPQVHVGLPVE